MNVVILSNFTSFVSLTSGKDNIFVCVVTSHSFKSRFESHARWTRWAPEINNYSRCVFDNFLNYSQTCNNIYFVVYRLLELLRWRNSTHATTTKLLHQSCQIRTTTTASHTGHRHLWLLRLLTSDLKRLLLTFFIEKCIGAQLKAILHLSHHWSKGSAHRCSQKFLGKIHNFMWNSLTK